MYDQSGRRTFFRNEQLIKASAKQIPSLSPGGTKKEVVLMNLLAQPPPEAAAAVAVVQVHGKEAA